MIAKLEKSYRVDYWREFGSSDKNWYTDVYHFLVKMDKKNPEFYPWERLFGFNVKIAYDGHKSFKNGNQWYLQSHSDKMDSFMVENLGDTLKTYPSRKKLVDDLKKLAEKWPDWRMEHYGWTFAES